MLIIETISAMQEPGREVGILHNKWWNILLIILTYQQAQLNRGQYMPAEVCLTDLAWDYPGV